MYGSHQHVPPHPPEVNPPPSYHLGSGRRLEKVHCTDLLHTLYTYLQIPILVPSVAEPKLFDSAPAPAPTFKKFPLRLRSQLRLELLWVPVFIAFK